MNALAAGSSAAVLRTAGSSDHDAATPARHAAFKGAVLAFDFGLRRIGVAVGDATIGIAHPLETITAEDNRRRFEAIAALVSQWRPVCFVVGHPVTADGAPHPLEPAIARFERRLRARFGLPVERVDETLSSWDAARRLHAAGLPARAQKGRLDAMAACVILETWFQQQRASAENGRGGCT